MRYSLFFLLLFCAGCAAPHKTAAPVAVMPVQLPPGVPTAFHTVARGETLWRIARMYGVDVDDLAALNRIADTARLETGQQLVLPAGKSRPVALPQGFTEDFIWPLKGTVLSKFSQSPERSVNKGLNIRPGHSAVVVASASGTVAFCHDDFVDLGKTVIIEHPGGFWTVYGRNEEVFVKPGERIQQGASIARAGSAGRDPAVYLHFEIRKGSQPQNPAFYLP